MSPAKLLIFDIENMAERGWYWPPRYETSIAAVDHKQHILTIAYKWLGERKVHVLALPDYKLYKEDPHSDRDLAKDFWEVINEAQVVIGHNSDSFDNKMVGAMFMRNKLPPPSPYKQVDTKKVAKRYGRFASNKLDDLGDDLGIGRKKQHSGFSLWLGCDSGDKKAWKTMAAYNKQDVLLTERLYLELRPWIVNHPNLGLIEARPEACPKCGVEGKMQSRGYNITTTQKRRKYQCVACGGWSSARGAETTLPRPNYV